MTGSVFVDTNVIVYGRDTSDPDKHARARAWMDHLWTSGRGRLSWQVLSEYYVTVTRKVSHPLEPSEARADVTDLATWSPVVVDHEVVEAAWAIQDRYRLSWWDALVVAAARLAGCSAILTEDLQAGQDLDGVVVVDPFTTEPVPEDG